MWSLQRLFERGPRWRTVGNRQTRQKVCPCGDVSAVFPEKWRQSESFRRLRYCTQKTRRDHLLKRFLILCVFSVAVTGTADASSIQLITNGDFESDTLAGWTDNVSFNNNRFYVINKWGRSSDHRKPNAD